MYIKVGMDILVDSLYETLSLFPYLYLTYLLMEYLEHKMSRRSSIYIRRAGQYGAVVGGFLGLIPQCGFSVAAANLYATGLITLGTLLAVFLSTSDEMLPILISGGVGMRVIFQILCLKVVYAIISGVAIDALLPEKIIKHKNTPDISTFCQREKCKCENKENIWRSAFKHTEKISLFIFFFSLVVNTAFVFGGRETIQTALVDMPILSKFIAAAVGLIPSCYPSVLLTQLYLDNAISIGTMMAGTLANAGLGYLVLYRVNANEKENIRILGLLFALGVFFGLVTEILF
ncbi:MAG: arsenic efflux protein [Acetobacter sp.]|nr:arsenic efflux protein [Acetobacter sp.]